MRKNTDRKSVSIFFIRRFNAHFAYIELSVFFHLVSKKLVYSVKFFIFFEDKEF